MRQIIISAVLLTMVCGCKESKTYNTAFYKMYELQGHVKTCKVTSFDAEYTDGTYKKGEEGGVIAEYEFNEGGYLTRDGDFTYLYNDDNTFKEGHMKGNDGIAVNLLINDLGQMYKQEAVALTPEYEDATWKTEYSFDQNGALISEKTVYWESGSEYKYKCDERGLRVSYSGSYNLDYETKTSFNTEYEYLKFDKQGSWTERAIKMTEINERIDIMTEEVLDSETTYSYQIQTREITYY
ncbi:MAG: hypothetical protein IJ338_01175 [Bacteroidaceae bacterium]|nr:hypothetical protein [Bacteroidaceae bacterium]